MEAKIIGIGSYLPSKVLSNDDLSKMVDTSDEWIVPRTGIRERRVAQGEETWEIAAKASKIALEMAKVTPDELDYIICTTVTPDYFFPSLACILNKELDAKKAISFDVSSACSGFIYALDIARDFIKLGKAKNILITCAECLSKIVDYSDRTTCILFGDGSGSAVVQAVPDTEDSRVIDVKLISDHTGTDSLRCRATQKDTIFSNDELTPQTLIKKDTLLMGGQEVFKFAVSTIPVIGTEVIERNSLKVEDMSQVIMHQANLRIINAAARKMGLKNEQVFVNIDKYGNTSSASVVIALDEAIKGGKVKKGDYVELIAFGAGYTAGATLIKW